MFIKPVGSNSIYRVKIADASSAEAPLALRELPSVFFAPAKTSASVMIKSFRQGLAIVEHDALGRNAAVHFYNEKTDKLRTNVYSAEDICRVDMMNENMFETYILIFYTTNSLGYKQLVVLNLASSVEHLKPLNPSDKNFMLRTEDIKGEGFEGVRYINTKMVGTLRMQLVDIVGETNGLSPFMRYFLSKQASYTQIHSLEPSLMPSLLTALDVEGVHMSLVVNHTEDLLALWPLLNEYNNIRTVVCRDLTAVPLERLQSCIESSPLRTNKQFLFFNAHSEAREQFSRIIVALLREHNTLGEFYYSEYDPKHPELFYYSLYNMAMGG